MKCSYEMTSGTIKGEDGESYSSYGICAVAPDGTVKRRVLDVTINGEKLALLVKQCNDGELWIGHLDDVIEDFLS